MKLHRKFLICYLELLVRGLFVDTKNLVKLVLRIAKEPWTFTYLVVVLGAYRKLDQGQQGEQGETVK